MTTSARSSRPAQRPAPVDILLAGHWVYGTLLVPESQSLVDYLATAGSFIKLTDASVPGVEREAEFLAIQRSAIRLVAPRGPGERVEAEGGAGITSPWRIACLFEHGTLEGRLDFLVNLRLSDYLRQQTGFLVVRDGHWIVGAAGGNPPRNFAWPAVLVNPAQVLGMVEGENPPGAGHPGRLPPTEWAP